MADSDDTKWKDGNKENESPKIHMGRDYWQALYAGLAGTNNNVGFSGVTDIPHGKAVTVWNPPCGDITQPANVSKCVTLTVPLPLGANVNDVRYQWVDGNGNWVEVKPNKDLEWALFEPYNVRNTTHNTIVEVTLKNWSENRTHSAEIAVIWAPPTLADEES